MNAMEPSPTICVTLKTFLDNALTTKINEREIFYERS